MTQRTRPAGVTALSVFFAGGATVSFVAAVSLLTHASALEPMWRLNPRARVAFAAIGFWSPMVMSVVSAACATAAVGLWRDARWGYRTAVGILVINVGGDAFNVLSGTEPRAVFGLPVAVLMLWYLLRPRIHDR